MKTTSKYGKICSELLKFFQLKDFCSYLTLWKGGENMAENNEMEKYAEDFEDRSRTLGVLTSGGESRGMNAAIRAVVSTALS